jgi:hypothetical protein
MSLKEVCTVSMVGQDGRTYETQQEGIALAMGGWPRAMGFSHATRALDSTSGGTTRRYVVAEQSEQEPAAGPDRATILCSSAAGSWVRGTQCIPVHASGIVPFSRTIFRLRVGGQGRPDVRDYSRSREPRSRRQFTTGSWNFATHCAEICVGEQT